MYEILGAVFFLHWFGDFVCQTRWMADNKSKNILALLFHVSVYTFILTSGLFFIVPPNLNIVYFGLANFLLHFQTDMITSRVTKYFWVNGDIHKFFATVGFDQFIHQVCLLVTVRMFLNGPTP